MTKSNQHIFALYVPTFWSSTDRANALKEIRDADILHRIIKVLRASLHEQFVFFDRAHHGLVQIVQISKKDITVQVLSFQVNIESANQLTFLLPLLKKEALEEAVYSLSEIGAAAIQLVVTQKSRQKLLHEKEFERLQHIVVSAAEQSKNYIYPDLFAPKKLHDLMQIADSSALKIVFDGEGKSFFDLREQLGFHRVKSTGQGSKLIALVGPEGGLTDEEINIVAQLSFFSCRLTSTTLRAVQAVAVGAALLKVA